MKVKCIRRYFDIELKRLIKVGEEYEVTQARATELSTTANKSGLVLVEIIDNFIEVLADDVTVVDEAGNETPLTELEPELQGEIVEAPIPTEVATGVKPEKAVKKTAAKRGRPKKEAK